MSESPSEQTIGQLPDGYRPSAAVVRDFHTQSDVNADKDSQHHTLGPGVNQAASGAHTHNGSDSPQLGLNVEITGSKGGNAALASVINAMVQILGVKDSTT